MIDQSTPLHKRLIDLSDSVLVVIDMQSKFFDKYETAPGRDVISRAAWLLRVAQLRGVPVLAMQEEGVGPLCPEITAALPEGCQVHQKNTFGCADSPEILAAIRATGRGTAILVGVETDVCVAHSALGLMQAGLDVAVLRDA